MLIRWLDGSFEEIDGKTDEEVIDTLRTQGRVGRNQVVKIIHDDTSHHVLITPETQMTTQECELIENRFQRHWMNLMNSSVFFETFREILLENQALVAGGSIVNAFLDIKINDFDVYVHHRNRIQIMKQMCDAFSMVPDISRAYTGSSYDKSFFTQNHILMRIPLISHANLPFIDLMIIPDHIPLKTVVTNFDLTFCESWWDGKHLYASDPQGLRNREGWLKPLYRDRLFVDLNLFTIKRIRKYRRRGLTVHLSGDDVDMILNQNVEEEKHTEHTEYTEHTEHTEHTEYFEYTEHSENQRSSDEENIVRYFLSHTSHYLKHLSRVTFNQRYRQQSIRSTMSLLTILPNTLTVQSIRQIIPERFCHLLSRSIYSTRHKMTPAFILKFPELFEIDSNNVKLSGLEETELQQLFLEFSESICRQQNIELPEQEPPPQREHQYYDFFDF